MGVSAEMMSIEQVIRSIEEAGKDSDIAGCSSDTTTVRKVKPATDPRALR
jgi:hypothetical protein